MSRRWTSLKGNHSVLSNEVRRYSRATLTERLTRAGFGVRRISYTNATILPLVAGVRLLQRVSGHEESQDEISIPPRQSMRPHRRAAVEAALLRVVNMPFGSSLMALARKPESLITDPNHSIARRQTQPSRQF